MKIRSLVVDVDEMSLKKTDSGFELRFQEYANGGVQRRAILKFKGGWWVQYIAQKLWEYVKDRQRELDSSKAALKGDS